MSTILVAGDNKANALVERRVQAEKLRDSVLQFTGKERWIATRKLWFFLYGNIPGEANAYQQHRDALAEVKIAKATALDPEYGRSRQALGIAYGERGNKNSTRRLVAIIPEGLIDMLEKFDSFNLVATKGKQREDNWREVRKTFPEYVVPEKH